MKTRICLSLTFALLAHALVGQIPNTISYQGFLTKANGVDPVDDGGTYKVRFTLLHEDGSLLSPSVVRIATVSPANGLFTCAIGEGVTDNLALPNNIWTEKLKVQLAVDGEPLDGYTDLGAPVALTSVPFAFQAHTVNATNITTGTIPNTILDPELQDLADGSLSGSKLGLTAGDNITFTAVGDNIQISSAGDGLSGSGAAGNVTYWTNTNSLGGNTNLFWDNSTGRLGINRPSPISVLDISSSASGGIPALRIQKASTEANSMVEFYNPNFSSIVAAGAIQESAGTISYNSFTGSHYTFSREKLEHGMLVTLTGEMERAFENNQGEPIYGVKPSQEANDCKILGSYFAPTAFSKESRTIELVMAVGNGEMWVASNGKDLKVGDYLISSSVKGHGQLNDGTYELAYIIGRVAENVAWSEVSDTIDGIKHKKISVFFESFIYNNQAARLQQEIANLRNELSRLRSEVQRMKDILTPHASTKP